MRESPETLLLLLDSTHTIILMHSYWENAFLSLKFRIIKLILYSVHCPIFFPSYNTIALFSSLVNSSITGTRLFIACFTMSYVAYKYSKEPKIAISGRRRGLKSA
ncbi:hypothetical protein PUN28_005821 [Cardiocondyla obscurior]|uniref:Uncharacterized protein n=1 Tax=Cardiocondyla obscurior TaxID=286306 RepID=A0AAW2G7E4_9HYME